MANDTTTSYPAGAIWDLDGTLLDSLAYWDRLGCDYLAEKGLQPPPGLQDILNGMELRDGAQYLKEHFALQEDSETILHELKARIRRVYTHDAQFFPGALDYLRAQHAHGTRLALFTSAEGEAARACLDRHGALPLFSCVISAADLGLDKSTPEAFLHVLGQLGTAVGNTTVYEDSEYAIQGAIRAGLAVISIKEFA